MLGNIISPIKVEDFFHYQWEKKPLVINRRAPDFFSHLLTLDAVDQIITTSDIRFPDIRILSAAREIERSEYTHGSGRLKSDNVWKLFQEGGTIVLNHQHKWQPELAKFCRSMEQYFSFPFQTNIYLTPPHAQGFDIHFDTHDVFVLQIEGRKDWQIFDRAIELPLASQGFDPKDVSAGDVQMECSLDPGDLLYIPRGILHKANALGETSLHATVGVLAKTWADFILEAVSQVMISNARFRESMPVGFARSEFNRCESEKIFLKRMMDLGRDVDFNKVFDDFVKEFVDTRPPLLHGQMKQLSHITNLTGESVVRRREGVIFRLERESDAISLSFYGKTIEFPVACEEPLSRLLSAREIALKDLAADPGDSDDILVLIRRLIKEGFVEMID